MATYQLVAPGGQTDHGQYITIPIEAAGGGTPPSIVGQCSANTIYDPFLLNCRTTKPNGYNDKLLVGRNLVSNFADFHTLRDDCKTDYIANYEPLGGEYVSWAAAFKDFMSTGNELQWSITNLDRNSNQAFAVLWVQGLSTFTWECPLETFRDAIKNSAEFELTVIPQYVVVNKPLDRITLEFDIVSADLKQL